jgi:hypothetical protein
MAFRASISRCASWGSRDNCRRSSLWQAKRYRSLLWRCKLFHNSRMIPNNYQQHFWGEMVANAGAGPHPIPYREQTAETLAQQIKEALHPEMRIRARQIGLRLQQERGCDNGIRIFHDSLEGKHARCSILPDRLAVWEVKSEQGPGGRLSTLAAAILLQRGLISVKEISM